MYCFDSAVQNGIKAMIHYIHSDRAWAQGYAAQVAIAYVYNRQKKLGMYK